MMLGVLKRMQRLANEMGVVMCSPSILRSVRFNDMGLEVGFATTFNKKTKPFRLKRVECVIKYFK